MANDADLEQLKRLDTAVKYGVDMAQFMETEAGQELRRRILAERQAALEGFPDVAVNDEGSLIALNIRYQAALMMGNIIDALISEGASANAALAAMDDDD